MPEMSEWEKALDEWLEPFLEVLGHKARCRWAPIYLRGLFGGSERKSVQPMAAALTPDDYDQLHNFVASPAWETAPFTATARKPLSQPGTKKGGASRLFTAGRRGPHRARHRPVRADRSWNWCPVIRMNGAQPYADSNHRFRIPGGVSAN